MIRKFLALSVALSCSDISGVTLTESSTEAHNRRKNGPMSWVLSEPPPAHSKMVVNKAHGIPPDAPFFLLDGVVHTTGSFESTGELRIGERLVVNTLEDAVWHVSGAIVSEPGSQEPLVKLGMGALKLSGANSHNGKTLLLQGELHVAGSQALGRRMVNANTGTRIRYEPGVTVGNTLDVRDIDIAAEAPAGSYAIAAPLDGADSVQWIVAGGEAVHTGSLHGNAALVKQGEGLLRIAGDAMGYSGRATVNQGTLAIDEFFLGSVQVNSGARLQGIGTIGSAMIAAGGTLAPGNSIGTLTVQGDLHFEPGAQFQVEATPIGAADFMQVNGKALLAGDVVALAQSGDWRASTRYTILKAEHGLDTTRFASVKANFTFLTPSLAYDDKHVYLMLDRNDKPIDEAAETITEDEVADVLEQDRGPVYEQVIVLEKQQARPALQQLSGSWAASLQSALIEDSRYVREAVLAHARAPSLPAGSGFWSQVFYSSADRTAQFAVPADERSVGGMVLGLGHSINPDWRIGGFFGVQHSRVWRGHGMADGRISSTHAGLDLAGRWL